MPNWATVVGSEATVRQVSVEGLYSSTLATGGAADGKEEAVVVDESPAAENVARVQLKVLVLVADRAPVEDALVGRIPLVERPIEGDRLAWAGIEHPGHVIRASSGVADDAS